MTGTTGGEGVALEKCVCGKPATVPCVVHWKNGDRTYHYCPSCALDVCAMEGVEPSPTDADIELDEDGFLSDGNHDDIAYEAGYLTEDEYDTANREVTDG